jgi:hypothetical protein
MGLCSSRIGSRSGSKVGFIDAPGPAVIPIPIDVSGTAIDVSGSAVDSASNTAPVISVEGNDSR